MADELPEDPTAVLFRRAIAHIVDALLYLAAFATSASLLASSAEAPGVDTSSFTDRFDLVGDDLIVYASNKAYTFTRSDQLAAAGVVLLLVLLNGVLFQGLSGKTLGKATLGLRAVRADGDPPGILRALGRELLWIIDGIPSFLIPLVGGFTALLTRGRRRLGDLVGGTYVVGKRFAGEPILGSDDGTVAGDEDDTLFAPAPIVEDLAPAEHGTGPVPALDAPENAAAGAAAGAVPADPDRSETDDLFAEPAPRGPLFGGLDGPAEGAAANEAGSSLFADPSGPVADPTPEEPSPHERTAADPVPAETTPADPTPAAGAATAAGGDIGDAASSASGASAASATEPEWDPDRKAYIYWEPARQEWLQHDAEADEWVPISRA